MRFEGFRRDVKDLYQAFDLFVCPSRYEPFGRVIAEALDSGVPVVACESQGPRDIARRYPIDLVPVDEVAKMAAALRRHHAAGRRRIESDLSEFSLEQTAARMEQAYWAVLSSAPAAASSGSGFAAAPRLTARSGERPCRRACCFLPYRAPAAPAN